MAEKFKPIGPKDLKGDEREVVEETDWYWLKHPLVENYHGKWTEYIAYLEGDQYCYYSKTLDALQNIEPLVERGQERL